MTDNIWQQARERSRQALASGALLPIETRCEQLRDGGCRFLLRTLDSLRHKEQAHNRLKQAGDTRRNPFKPHEPALLVSELGPDHLCLLNKFYVLEQHLLLVTREYESQLAPLNRADFQAVALCLQQGDALMFFNGGPLAGASQPHKHLQLIPLPMLADRPLPFSPQLNQLDSPEPQRLTALPFCHGALALPEQLFDDPATAADRLLSDYRQLCDRLALQPGSDGAMPPYNLLLSREWMLMVPRCAEAYQGISVNALGYVGALLVKNDEQATLLKQAGLMKVLTALA
ncbi:ATP adenylyltransferase family protein [Marinobacterium arenosum]|uniref:ATP adenylyltransferase family protein n=1 Tax=Marinobacterium arenosum TaxID=2862496 RepID=UPI001C953588|nr:DUF4922 domain-containing protein [Marinobacterium arenosum]MBY4676304.1 hypothetical protein [Marinobacterium arenosum]